MSNSIGGLKHPNWNFQDYTNKFDQKLKLSNRIENYVTLIIMEVLRLGSTNLEYSIKTFIDELDILLVDYHWSHNESNLRVNHLPSDNQSEFTHNTPIAAIIKHRIDQSEYSIISYN